MRYVIDFYNAAPEPGKPIGMHLDVRPALDSAEAAVDRVYMQLRWMGWMGRPTDSSSANSGQAG